MLRFDYPWLFLLLPIPWFVWAFMPALLTPQLSVRVPFIDRLTQAASRSSLPPIQGGRTRFNWVWGLLAWCLLLTALARPMWIADPLTANLPTRDLLLLVDLSASMDQEDFESRQGQAINRLDAVKEVVGDFLEHREGDRVSLVVFGNAAYLQAPFSTDLSLTRRLLDESQVGMAGPKTALGDAIGLGVNLFEQSEAPAKTIIALTDGNDTKSQVPPTEAARIAHQRGIRIHTVAIGDPTTAGEDRLDDQTLKEVANSADGTYFFAADRESLQSIYDELDQLETSEIQTLTHRPRSDLFFWPLTGFLLVSMLEKVLGVATGRRRKGIGAPPTSVRVNPHTGKLEVISS